LKNAAGLVVYVFLLSNLELWIILVVLTTSFLAFLVNNRMQAWSHKHRDEEVGHSRRMNYVSEKAVDFTIAKDIRIFGLGPWLNEIYLHTLRLHHTFVTRAERVYFWGDVSSIVLTLLRNGIAYAYLFYLVIHGTLTASEFLLFFTAVGGFASWVSGLLSSLTKLHTQSLDVSTVREFLAYPEPFCFEQGLPLEVVKDHPYQIELRNVSFSYPGSDQEILRNINLTIRPGERLSIIGLNGAGKTTLVKLISGFYDPTGGEVLLDGENIQKYNRRHYYKLFTGVFQDFSILPGTFAENIAVAIQTPHTERVKACAKKAEIAGKIEKLPNQYDTYIGKEVYDDGTALSGGEMQRLLLARALYQDAPIILLDEPTAALDPIAESDIYKKYADLTHGRTSLYISHRLASALFCDRILMMENGSIIEEGTHDTLMKKGGKYKELYEIQSHYYKGESVHG
jgi:ATP-binding cassette subfamily B protein